MNQKTKRVIKYSVIGIGAIIGSMFLYSLIHSLLIIKDIQDNPTEDIIKEAKRLMNEFNTADTPEGKCYILNKLRGDDINECILLKQYQFKFDLNGSIMQHNVQNK